VGDVKEDCCCAIAMTCCGDDVLWRWRAARMISKQSRVYRRTNQTTYKLFELSAVF